MFGWGLLEWKLVKISINIRTNNFQSRQYKEIVLLMLMPLSSWVFVYVQHIGIYFPCTRYGSASIFIPKAFRNRSAFLVGRSFKRLSSSLSILNVFIFLKLFPSLHAIKLVLFFMVYCRYSIDRMRLNTFACDEAFMFVGLLLHRLNDTICWCNDAFNINLYTMYDQFNPVPVCALFFLFSLSTLSFFV